MSKCVARSALKYPPVLNKLFYYFFLRTLSNYAQLFETIESIDPIFRSCEPKSV